VENLKTAEGTIGIGVNSVIAAFHKLRVNKIHYKYAVLNPARPVQQSPKNNADKESGDKQNTVLEDEADADDVELVDEPAAVA